MGTTIDSLLLGFSVALQPDVLLYAFLGCLVGTLVGVLPGVGPLAGISILLPVTFGLDATKAIVMLSGIYYGSQYGGSTTSILMRIPGEASSVMTCLDGYAMAKKGRAGAALAIAAVGSFIAGTFGIIMLTLLAPPLASFALRFGPPEFTALLVLGLVFLAYMSSTSLVRTLVMACLGLLIGCIGIDVMSGQFRYAFDIKELADGIGIVPVAVGLFGLGEILSTPSNKVQGEVMRPKMSELMPTRKEWGEAAMPIARGSVLGFLVGIVPGSAHIISSFMSYAIERKLSKNPDEFGNGAVAGVAGPESANNAAVGGAYIPMMTLGIPGDAVTAVIIGAMYIHGLKPGPMLMIETPHLFWFIVGNLTLANCFLLVFGLTGVRLFAKIVETPKPILLPLILVLSAVGAYAINNNPVDVYWMLGFGVFGYFLKMYGFQVGPVILGMILGPMMDKSYRQAMISAESQVGQFIGEFFTAPLSAIILAAMVLSMLSQTAWWKRRRGRPA